MVFGVLYVIFFFVKQKPAYELRMSDWSSDVCSSDLLRRRRWDRWWNGVLAGFALLVPVALGYGYHLGNGAGEASGYARARDEVAAASWANTVNGKLARQLDQASTMTIPAIAGCPKGNGGHSEKRQGVHRSEKHT